MPELTLNARLSAPLVARFCALTRPATLLLEEALAHEPRPQGVRLQLLAVARSCADLNGHEHIHDEDLIVALSMPPFPLATGRLPRHHA
jgi:predicted ATPase with chaperone activity